VIEMPKQITIEQMQELAKQKGGKCLSKAYRYAKEKLVWKCDKGHIWETAPMHIKQGTWCPICSKDRTFNIKQFNKRKYKDKEYNFQQLKELAREHNGHLLSDQYVNNKVAYTWQCSKGHVWECRVKNIRSGNWCAKCAADDRKQNELQQMKSLAKQREGLCLSDSYVTDQSNMLWQCSNGHRWEATPANVKRGKWCAICALRKGDNNNKWKGGITPLSNYLRNNMKKWKKESFKKYGKKCAITNSEDGIIHIHHIKHFNVIRDEVLNKYDIPLYHTINEYDPEMLDFIIEKLKEKHEEMMGIPIRKEIHILFHKIYGKENTTIEDLKEFKQRFLAGEFNDVKIKSQPISLII
jgi:hypothetical protein